MEKGGNYTKMMMILLVLLTISPFVQVSSKTLTFKIRFCSSRLSDTNLSVVDLPVIVEKKLPPGLPRRPGLPCR